MRNITRFYFLLLVAAVGVASGGSPASGDAPGAIPGSVPITWQHHHATFSYFGLTVLYSCDGLEEQVRRILLYLGARGDLKVIATGCPDASGGPTRNAWINADFDVPVPLAGSGAPAGNPEVAQWLEVTLTPKHPSFMGKGDCELIESMKDLLNNDLNIRGLDYTTSCFPGSLSDDGFNVKGEALKIAKTGKS
jgi:hypothetical protein